MARNFNANELNQLLKAGLDPEKLAETIGEKPVEYVTNRAFFYGREFIVEEDSLIPRPETEALIDIALENIPRSRKKIVWADVGSGCGNIGITMALEMAARGYRFNGYLLEKYPKTKTIIEKNAANLLHKQPITYTTGERRRKISERQLFILESDLLSAVQKSVRFDLILANLPYIPQSRWQDLPKSVREYEPRQALLGGDDGLQYINRLLFEARDKAKSRLQVILEVDDIHSPEMLDKGNQRYWQIEPRNDENGKMRYWVCTIK
jgi:release factor glutamine methyltransferase